MDFFDELKRRLSNSLRFFYALFQEGQGNAENTAWRFIVVKG